MLGFRKWRENVNRDQRERVQERAEEHGRYFVEILIGAFSAVNSRVAIQASLDAGDAKGWKLLEVSSGRSGRRSETLLFWDTKPERD